MNTLAGGDPGATDGVGVAGDFDVTRAVSTVQAVRKSNRARTPAPVSRMFALGRCEFKLAEFDTNNLMAIMTAGRPERFPASMVTP